MKMLIIGMLITLLSPQCNEKFEIVKATSQEWAGGRQETGHGTNYEFTIVPEVNSDLLQFDQLWIGDKFFEISCYQKGKRVKNDTFGPGDTITISVSDRVVQIKMKDEKPIEKKQLTPPKKYKGEALLSYTLKGERMYTTIKNFTKLEALNYP